MAIHAMIFGLATIILAKSSLEKLFKIKNQLGKKLVKLI
jgi:hypothetical protein